MADRLKDSVALITGGGNGIGAACARIFCAEGAAVGLVDRDPEALRQTVHAVRRETPDARIQTFTADVTDAAATEAAVSSLASSFGKLDVLVNNAAMRNTTALAEVSEEEWRAMLGVNLVAVSTYCKAALPHLRAAGNGSIVNVSSSFAVIGRKGMGLYDATKAAMLSLTRTLAFEESPHGVRVNAVCPGGTLTAYHLQRARERGRTEQEMLAERKTNSLIGRWARPDEIAYPILWLASREASYITGTSLMVDGGVSIM